MFVLVKNPATLDLVLSFGTGRGRSSFDCLLEGLILVYHHNANAMDAPHTYALMVFMMNTLATTAEHIRDKQGCC